jgi:hypothetical protein
MSVGTISFESSPATITCTLTSLANAGWRQTAEVDNSTNQFIEVFVTGSIQIGAVSGDGAIIIYAYGSVDGTTYSGGVGTTDQTITWGTTGSTSYYGYRQLFPVGYISISSNDDNKDIKWGPFSLSQAFSGVVPKKWGLVFYNTTGLALHATGTNNAVKYLGVKYAAG